MTTKNCLTCPLKSATAKWFYGTGLAVLLSIASWGFYEYRNFFVFKNLAVDDISEQKILLNEIKKAVEIGNKENLQRDIKLELWMTRIDQQLKDRNEKLVGLCKELKLDDERISQ